MPDPGEARALEENLSALAARNPSLAASIRRSAADPRVVFLTSRNGLVVPGIRSRAGTVPLHSLYDPRREARRLAEECRGAGCLAIGGLGAGYHVAAVLEDPGTNAVIVLEKDEGVLRALLSGAPLARVLQDPRVTIAAGLGEVRKTIVNAWQPALMGALRSLPLRAWQDLEGPWFDQAAQEVGAAIETVRADYSVQSHFGKRWMSNILSNLSRVASDPDASGPGIDLQENSAAVTAAGPSLDHQLRMLSAERDKVKLIATDTSLPALLRSGIRPDAVLSIDCQNHGYHHFLQGIPDGTALYMDLASPPQLARLHRSPRFVASGHPFVRYVESRCQRLLRIDTSGGNVTHAAVSLAQSLGAKRISVYGADFCYPDGKAYARGTYLYDYFWSGQSMVSPAETLFFSFAFGPGSPGSTPPTREKRNGRLLYSTPVLLGYRDRFIALMDTIDAEVRQVQGDGFVLSPRRTGRHETAPAGGDHPPGDRPRAPGTVSNFDWREFLGAYADDLEALPPSGAFRESAAELLHTLLPVAARVVKEGCAPGPAAIEEARRWTLLRIRRALQE